MDSVIFSVSAVPSSKAPVFAWAYWPPPNNPLGRTVPSSVHYSAGTLASSYLLQTSIFSLVDEEQPSLLSWGMKPEGAVHRKPPHGGLG